MARKSSVVSTAKGAVEAAELAWRLPFPHGVNVNHIYEPQGRLTPYGVVFTGGRKLTEQARTWKGEVECIVRDGGMPQAPAGKLALVLEIFFPDDRRRDIDGLIKATQDALASALQIDDKRIRGLGVIGTIDRANPRIEARIFPLGACNAEHLRRWLRGE